MPKVGNAVLVVERWILARLRNRRSFRRRFAYLAESTSKSCTAREVIWGGRGSEKQADVVAKGSTSEVTSLAARGALPSRPMAGSNLRRSTGGNVSRSSARCFATASWTHWPWCGCTELGSLASIGRDLALNRNHLCSVWCQPPRVIRVVPLRRSQSQQNWQRSPATSFHCQVCPNSRSCGAEQTTVGRLPRSSYFKRVITVQFVET